MLRRAWIALQHRSWPVRWLIKVLAVAIVVFFVLYPRPSLLVRDIHHVRNLNALVQPNDPALAPWAEELAARIPPHATPAELHHTVEQFVYDKVPYAFDWQTWGVVDYTPTVDEIIAKGREDCDGRAVIAASLLRHYDPTAVLATDFMHMWVNTSSGPLMHPSGPAALVATKEGYRINWRNALDITHPAIGMALYPFGRELIIFVAVWWALCDPRMRARSLLLAALLALNGVLMIRLAASNPWQPVRWGVWLGFAQIAFAIVWAARSAHAAMRRSTRASRA
jgi:hypothetical protein